MKDYYLLIGLNIKDIKIININQKNGDLIEPEKEIDRWISKCINMNIPEFIEAAGTISRWKEYIINSFIDERYSNGFTEGINNKIKVIKRAVSLFFNLFLLIF